VTAALLGVAGAVVFLYAAFVGWLVVAGRRRHLRAVLGFVPDCAVCFRRLVGDERVPRSCKLVLIALLGYLAVPFDLVPDFIPVAGQLDDAVVVVMALRWVFRRAGEEAVRESWPGPSASLGVLLRVTGTRVAG
jgi:uncharacterized membrane protein YkvA (DUF1232 family)